MAGKSVTKAPVAEYEMWVEGELVEETAEREWALEGGAVILKVSDIAPTDPGHLFGCWTLSVQVESPSMHKLDFHWLVALQINHTTYQRRTCALRQVNLPLEDNVSAAIDFPPPPNFREPRVRLALHLHFLRKEQTRLPVFAQRHATDVEVQCHQRTYFVNPALLRINLRPSSPLITSLNAGGQPEWSHIFPSCADFVEYLYHLYSTRRHVTHPTAALLGRLAVATHFPALQRRVCYFIRKAGGVPLSWRIMVADSASLYATIPVLVSRLPQTAIATLRRLVSSRIRHRLSWQGYWALLSVLTQTLNSDRLSRKRLPKTSFTAPVPGITPMVLRAGEAEFHVCKELMCEMSPVLAEAAMGGATEVVLEAEERVVGALLHLVYPERLLPKEEELCGVLGLVKELGAVGVGLELEERLRRKLDGSETSLVAGLRVGRAWGLSWLLQKMVTGLGRGGVVDRVRKELGEEEWEGLGPEIQAWLWEAAVGGQGLDLPDAFPNCFPHVRVSFTKGLRLPHTSSHTLFGIHNDVIFA